MGIMFLFGLQQRDTKPRSILFAYDLILRWDEGTLTSKDTFDVPSHDGVHICTKEYSGIYPEEDWF